MKKLFTLLALIVTLTIFAQAPQGFNYQATVRNSSGVLITNQNVYFKFNIMLNSQTSVPIYTETHYVPTDDLGQVNLVIGTGTASVGTFATISWGTGSYFLGIEINTGPRYIAMGTTQLMSVPYALYAQNAENIINIPSGINAGDVLTWNGSQWSSLQNPTPTNLPVLQTVTVSAITGYTATGGGSISSNGGSNITSKGVCWSTNPNPTIADRTTNNGTGSSVFSSNFTILLPGTTYYYRSYATNANGTGYGATLSFKTLNFATLTTVSPTKITRISAYSGCNMISDGGSGITGKGLVWSTSPNPTIALPTKTTDGSGLLNYTRKLTTLTQNTTYYLRAYATNSVGTSYGNVIVFSTKVGYEGTYKAIDAAFYRIGVLVYDAGSWPAVTVIEAVDATTYRVVNYLGAANFTGNTWYFTVVNDIIDIPLTYGGFPQLGNAQPFISCASNPTDMANVNCATSNYGIRDNVTGKDQLKMSFGYYTSSGAVGPRTFYQVLERIVD
ncbi:hypothetical protein MCEGE10_01920 [Flavobacteriaceae bacterium]